MDIDLLVATNQGLIRYCRQGDGWQEIGRALTDRHVTSVIARGGVVLAGTTRGVARSDDHGQTWRDASEGLAVPHVRWMAYHPDIDDREFAGTEPASIFVSHDGAQTWRECSEVAVLRDQHSWWLPYSPEAGCVRGFAFHGDRGYAAVEVGGVLRSDDTGETWRLASGSSGAPTFDISPAPWVFADVHSIETHPSSPDRVFAVTAEGLYRSHDGGTTWEVTHAGSYCRAAWVDPADPDHIVLGPADSVSRMNGRIEQSRDGGATWSLASYGLDLPWPDIMVERFTRISNDLMAVTNNGRLYAASLETLHWQRLFSDIPDINAATTMGDETSEA